MNEPKQIGAQIRELLFSLRAEGSSDQLSTDELRRMALDYAGICWLTPGEMAPQCCCDWDLEHPAGPRKQMEYEKINLLQEIAHR